MNLSQLTKILKPFLEKGSFELPKPQNPEHSQVHVIGVSGGVDSSAVALCMKVLFPDVNFLYVHTPTGFEPQSNEESLNLLQAFLGREILKPSAKDSLISSIDKYGGYLPSARSRTCTSALKIKPMQDFLTMLKSALGGAVEVHTYVGLRFDEEDRNGAEYSKSSGITNHFPLRDLKLTKTDVNSLVEQTIGIPTFYFDHSRSSCIVCPFHRLHETLASWEREPHKVQLAAEFEVLPEDIKAVYNDLPTSISSETGIARNWMAFVRPDWLGYPKMGYQGEKAKHKARVSNDLFGSKSVFVAVEYEFSPGYGWINPMVYFERIVTYSSSMSGIKRALSSFWKHRIDTKELHAKTSVEALEEGKQIAIIEISIDEYDAVFPGKPDSTFTWSSSKRPLLQVRKMVKVIEHILLKAGLEQVGEHDKLKLITQDFGTIVNYTKYQAPSFQDLLDGEEDSEEPKACEICSR